MFTEEPMTELKPFKEWLKEEILDQVTDKKSFELIKSKFGLTKSMWIEKDGEQLNQKYYWDLGDIREVYASIESKDK